MKQPLLILLTLAFFISCEKDNLPSAYDEKALIDCIESSVANSPKEPAAEYVQFKLNDRRILINSGDDEYRQFNDIALTFTTSGPILNPQNDTSRQYLLRIGFDQFYQSHKPPSDQIYIALKKKENLSVVEFVDKYIHVGDLKMKKKQSWDKETAPELEDGFEINYWCACDCSPNGPVGPTPGGGTVLAFLSSAPEQDGFLRCTQLERVDLGETVGYHIEFEFACKLYRYGIPDSQHPVPYYRNVAIIKEGKMVVDFVVEK